MFEYGRWEIPEYLSRSQIAAIRSDARTTSVIWGVSTALPLFVAGCLVAKGYSQHPTAGQLSWRSWLSLYSLYAAAATATFERFLRNADRAWRASRRLERRITIPGLEQTRSLHANTPVSRREHSQVASPITTRNTPQRSTLSSSSFDWWTVGKLLLPPYDFKFNTKEKMAITVIAAATLLTVGAAVYQSGPVQELIQRMSDWTTIFSSPTPR